MTAPFTFADAREIVTPPHRARILPWASESPAWTGPGPAEVAKAGGSYGTLRATPAAKGWRLDHDPGQRFFAMQCDECPGDVVEMAQRRWHVVQVLGPAPKSAVCRVAA